MSLCRLLRALLLSSLALTLRINAEILFFLSEVVDREEQKRREGREEEGRETAERADRYLRMRRYTRPKER